MSKQQLSIDNPSPHPAFKLRHTLRGHEHYAVFRIVLSPNGEMLASTFQDNTIRIWNISTGKLLQTLKGSSKRISCVAWSPDGRTLASNFNETTICLWNSKTGKILRMFEGHLLTVLSIAWSSDGKTLVSGS
jgi:WD40 repeat protein